MKSRESKRLIEQLAKKHKLTIAQVHDIVYAPFAFVAETMRSGNRETMDFKSVYLRHFGTFMVKPGRRKYFLEYMKQQKQKEKDNEESTDTKE